MAGMYKASLALAVALGLTVGSTGAARSQTSAPVAKSTGVTKQQQKAQRKAERKARRAKKNFDLNQLEKNGYDPAGGRNDYPQNLQNAESKIRQQKGGAAPAASTP